MNEQVELSRVLSNTNIGADVWMMELYAPAQAAVVKIGQFCNIRVTNETAPLLRRPISYAGFNREKGTITLLYRTAGKGTKIMSTLKEGDILDCLGPLGQPFKTMNSMLLVGGGVGVAPMLCTVANLEKHQTAQVIIGCRSASELFWVDLFKDYDVKVHVTTDDGTAGTKGYPTTIMGDLFASHHFDTVLTCGPTPMMRGVSQESQKAGIPCQVSLEERMGCATGGCLACSIEGKSGRRYRVCRNGPVFDGEEVFF